MKSLLIVLVLISITVLTIYFIVGRDEKDSDSVPAIYQIKEAYNDNAIAAGRSAAYAQRIYKSTNDRYAVNLDELYTIDRGISSDPEVTFVFGICNEQDFAFTTLHAKGTKSYVFK